MYEFMYESVSKNNIFNTLFFVLQVISSVSENEVDI
jgi:hypothetical protein